MESVFYIFNFFNTIIVRIEFSPLVTSRVNMDTIDLMKDQLGSMRGLVHSWS